MSSEMGKHYLLNVYGCSFNVLNNELFLKQVITQAAIASKANLQSITSKQFHPQGVTVLALLSESHISIHTWPEEGTAAIDIYTCGNCRPELGCYKIIDLLGAEDHKLNKVDR